MNRIAGPDGLATRCTLLVSKENVIFKANRAPAMSPSLRNIRLLIAELLQERSRNLGPGDSFIIDATSLVTQYDLERNHFQWVCDFLDEEGLFKITNKIFSPMQLVWRPGLEKVLTFPALGGSHAEADYSRALNWFKSERRLATGDLQSLVNSAMDDGFLTRLEAKSHQYPKAFWEIRVMRSPRLPKTELDDMLSRFSRRLQQDYNSRIDRDNKVLEIFTSGRCFTAVLAQQMGTEPPKDWKCGICQPCITSTAANLDPPVGRPVHYRNVDGIIQAIPDRYRQDPRFLTRVALGVASPRARILGLEEKAALARAEGRATIWRCMPQVPFKVRSGSLHGLTEEVAFKTNTTLLAI